MAINKKLIHFNKFDDFKKELDNGNILDKSIIFIKDTKQIYTHKSGYLTIPEGAREGQVLGFKDGTVKWVNEVEIPSLDDYVTKSYVDSALSNKVDTTAITDMATKSWVNSQSYLNTSTAANTYQPKGNYLTSHQSLANYALKSEIPSNTSQLNNDSNFITASEVSSTYLTKTAASSTYEKVGSYLQPYGNQSLKNIIVPNSEWRNIVIAVNGNSNNSSGYGTVTINTTYSVTVAAAIEALSSSALSKLTIYNYNLKTAEEAIYYKVSDTTLYVVTLSYNIDSLITIGSTSPPQVVVRCYRFTSGQTGVYCYNWLPNPTIYNKFTTSAVGDVGNPEEPSI